MEDALYFCVITVTTVGFGDFVPTSDASKLFVSAYVLIGLSLFSTCSNLWASIARTKQPIQLRCTPLSCRLVAEPKPCLQLLVAGRKETVEYDRSLLVE